MTDYPGTPADLTRLHAGLDVGFHLHPVGPTPFIAVPADAVAIARDAAVELSWYRDQDEPDPALSEERAVKALALQVLAEASRSIRVRFVLDSRTYHEELDRIHRLAAALGVTLYTEGAQP